MTARSIRMKLFLLATTLGCALAARDAFAQTCTNDINCTANPACGGEVCDWVVTPTMTCKAAGGQAKGHDGWCMTDTDCKCHDLGATCNTSVFSCTFTRPCEADGGTCSGAGGSTGTGTAGTSGGGGSGGGGCSVAGQGAGGVSALLAGLGLVALGARRRRR